MNKLTVLAAAATVLTTALSSMAAAQDQCIEGPLTIMVPRSAGGGLDLLGRMVGAEWAKELGVDLVVENKGGGAIGLAEAYREPADGQTVVSWSPPGEYMLQVQSQLPFKIDEWEMIGATNSEPTLIAVAANSRFKSFQDVVTASTTGGERLSASLVGRTSTSAPEFGLFASELGVNWALVPFDGGGEQTTALMGGHTDIGIRNGGLYDLHPAQIRVLAVAAPERIKELPDVPTVQEVTGKPIIWSAVRGFAVRKGTPPATLQCLRAAFDKAAKSPEIVENQFKKIGFRYEFLDAAAFEKTAAEQTEIAARLMQ